MKLSTIAAIALSAISLDLQASLAHTEPDYNIIRQIDPVSCTSTTKYTNGEIDSGTTNCDEIIISVAPDDSDYAWITFVEGGFSTGYRMHNDTGDVDLKALHRDYGELWRMYPEDGLCQIGLEEVFCITRDMYGNRSSYSGKFLYD